MKIHKINDAPTNRDDVYSHASFAKDMCPDMINDIDDEVESCIERIQEGAHEEMTCLQTIDNINYITDVD